MTKTFDEKLEAILEKLDCGYGEGGDLTAKEAIAAIKAAIKSHLPEPLPELKAVDGVPQIGGRQGYNFYRSEVIQRLGLEHD